MWISPVVASFMLCALGVFSVACEKVGNSKYKNLPCEQNIRTPNNVEVCIDSVENLVIIHTVGSPVDFALACPSGPDYYNLVAKVFTNDWFVDDAIYVRRFIAESMNRGFRECRVVSELPMLAITRNDVICGTYMDTLSRRIGERLIDRYCALNCPGRYKHFCAKDDSTKLSLTEYLKKLAEDDEEDISVLGTIDWLGVLSYVMHLVVFSLVILILLILTVRDRDGKSVPIKIGISMIALFVLYFIHPEKESSYFWFDNGVFLVTLAVLSLGVRLAAGEAEVGGFNLALIGSIVFMIFGGIKVGAVVFLIVIAGLAIISYRQIKSNNNNEMTTVILSFSTLYTMFRTLMILGHAYSRTGPMIEISMAVFKGVLGIGAKNTLFENALRESSRILLALIDMFPGHKFTGHDVYAIQCGVIILYVSLRLVVGVVSVRRIFKGPVQLEELWYGLSAYSVDVTCGWRLLSHVYGGQRRALSYDLFATGLLLLEWCYAKDILFIRFCAFLIDVTFNDSKVRKVNRFLSADVSIDLLSFPQIGSWPSACFETLGKLRAATRVVQTEICRGCALLVYQGGVKRVVTVDHVIKGSLKDCVIDVSTMQCLNNIGGVKRLNGDDPISSYAFINQDVPAVEVAFITASEVKNVSYLFWMSPEGMITPITNFNFDKNELFASVNLKSGDSGSPVLAIMKDGAVRYVGAVSRGSANVGSGNIISTVLAGKHEFQGSPGADMNLGGIERDSIALENAHAIINKILRENAADIEDDVKPAKKSRRFDRRKKMESVKELVGDMISLALFAELLDALDNGKVIAFNKARENPGYRIGKSLKGLGGYWQYGGTEGGDEGEENA